ncbi:MAG: type IV pilus modification PilV family protein [Candidatus Saccharimonadales bacterium]
MRRFWQQQKERGDTIVEVLISISVVSLVLGGAYVTTNRSLLATRAAEERGNSLKLAESQVEQLKGLAKSDPEVIFGSGTPMPFCISSSTGQPVLAESVSGEATADCKLNASGVPTTTQPIYNVSVQRASDGNTFTVTNEWVDASGRITDNLRLIYRVYE